MLTLRPSHASKFDGICAVTLLWSGGLGDEQNKIMLAQNGKLLEEDMTLAELGITKNKEAFEVVYVPIRGGTGKAPAITRLEPCHC